MNAIENLAFTVDTLGEPRLWTEQVFDAAADVLYDSGHLGAARKLSRQMGAETLWDDAVFEGHCEAEEKAEEEAEKIEKAHDKALKELREKLETAEGKSDDLHSVIEMLAKDLRGASNSVEVLTYLCDWLRDVEQSGDENDPDCEGVAEQIESLEE